MSLYVIVNQALNYNTVLGGQFQFSGSAKHLTWRTCSLVIAFLYFYTLSEFATKDAIAHRPWVFRC